SPAEKAGAVMADSALTSRELMARANISRATLNNYIGLGILPKPALAPGEGPGRQAPRIGRFPAGAVATLETVERLKRAGHTMAEIAAMLAKGVPAAETPSPPSSAAPVLARAVGDGRGMAMTLDRVECPAYLVNARFEIEWANERAAREILGPAYRPGGEISERNVFAYLLHGGPAAGAEGADDLLALHMAIAKRRLPRAGLFALGRDLDAAEMERLVKIHDTVSADQLPMGPLARAEINLAGPGEPDRWFDVYASFFREGVFFTYQPAADDKTTLLQFLSRRDVVIRDLLKKRPPHLTDVAVMVADLQESVKISAELPPEQYFQLINDVWGAMEPILRRYYATHGKHAGDGMVCYFLPQPDSNFALNGLRCAAEMREAMHKISRDWRLKKNWLNELRLNIGLHAGQEWFGTYQTPTHVEFTVLGDTVNMAGRLSDFARGGQVLASKTLLGKLTAKEREGVRYGTRRRAEDGTEMFAPETFARVSNLVDLNNPKFEKFRDIAVLPVAEVVEAGAAVPSPA
ncbi:MAG: adenylate/guanylate cyclase domain-containing protein, partial [Pseudomonadota bacterium]